jgi:hypothetical protein
VPRWLPAISHACSVLVLVPWLAVLLNLYRTAPAVRALGQGPFTLNCLRGARLITFDLDKKYVLSANGERLLELAQKGVIR